MNGNKLMILYDMNIPTNDILTVRQIVVKPQAP